MAGRALSWLLHALVFCWLLFALAVLVLRYAVLPGIDGYRGEIEAAASAAVGLRVAIDRVEAGWDGLRPQLDLKGVRVFDAQGHEALSFRAVDAVIAWQSVLTLAPQFHRLHAEGPVLRAERTAEGRFFVAGFPFAPKAASDPALIDWILGQAQISIADATVLWKDAARGSAELRLEKVALLLQNDEDDHRFGVTATPAGPLAGPIEIRGELSGTSVARAADWSGHLYVAAGDVDLAAGAQWIDWPVAVRRGRGNLRAWGTLVRGSPGEVSVDLALTDVEATLAEDLPPLDLTRLSGRLTVRREAGRIRLSGLDVALDLRNGTQIRPTGFHLQWTPLPGGGTQGLGVLTEADLGEMAAVAAYLPIDRGTREALLGHAPSGTLNNLQISWSGAASGLSAYSVNTGFTGLGMAASGKLPGFEGLDGTLVADEKSGTLHVDSGPVQLDFPAVFPGAAAQPPGDTRLLLDELAADARWTVAEVAGRKSIEFDLQQVRFSGPDGVGEASGRYRWDNPVAAEAADLGEIDLTARLSDADAAGAWRFLPAVLPATVRHWVKKSVRAGRVQSAEVLLKGRLADFPFRNNVGGLFRVTVALKAAELQYDSDWPVMDGIDADLKFEGSSLGVVARKSSTSGMPLARIDARIGDFSAPSVSLQVNGEAQGEMRGFFRFLDQSPLGATLGHFYDEIRIDGDGHLKLDLAIPLDRPEMTRVKGQFDLAGGRVKIDPLLPPVTDLAGRVVFSERSAQASGLDGSFLGRPLSVSLRADSKEVRVAASGEVSVDQLKRHYAREGSGNVSAMAPLLDHLAGSFPWRTAVAVKGGQVRVGVESSLEGLASSLPAPLEKTAERVLPVRFERLPLPSERRGKVLRDQFKVGIGDLASATLVRRSDTTVGAGGVHSERTTVERGVLAIADSLRKTPDIAALPEQGLRVVVRQPAIDLDAWRSVLLRPATANPAALAAVDAQPGSGTPAATPAPASAAGSDIEWPTPEFAIEAQSLRLIGRQWRDVKLTARPRKGGLAGRIQARDMSGAWIWESAGKGTFRARLAQLVLPDEKPLAGASNGNGHGGVPESSAAPHSLPALDIVAEDFVLGSRSLGKVELMADNDDGAWKVSRFALDNKDGKVAATGRWLVGNKTRAPRSEVEFSLEAGDIGLFLARFGYPDAIRQGKGQLEGQLAWTGSPLSINQPSLSGRLKVKGEKGQFNKLEPGFGKLLSILSLQTLPRRVALDFRDVFSEGFAFDDISGTTLIADGVLRTSDLTIEGVPAKVLMKGEVDLGRDTQNLHVTVQPEIGGTVALGAAVVVNPVAGVAALIAQKVLRDPLNKAFAFEYRISGSLTDPKVEKIGGPPPPPAEKK